MALNSSSRKVLFGGESKVVFNGGGEFHARVPRGAASLIGVVLVLVGLDSFSLKSETCLGPFWLNLHQQGPVEKTTEGPRRAKLRRPLLVPFFLSIGRVIAQALISKLISGLALVVGLGIKNPTPGNHLVA